MKQDHYVRHLDLQPTKQDLPQFSGEAWQERLSGVARWLLMRDT